MDEYTAKLTLNRRTIEVVQLARNLYPSYSPALFGVPVVKFDIRGRSCGARAIGHYHLQYNLDWFAVDSEDYLKTIVPHEVAHIVASATRLGRGHDSGWRSICKALGGNGERLNVNPLVNAVPKARRTVEHLYRTDTGREVWVGPVHHSRLQSRGATLHPVTQRPMYALRSQAGRIEREGYTGQTRLKA